MTGLRRLGMVLVFLCLVQYLLGMLLNLYVAIPRHHPGTSGSDYFERAFQSVLWGHSPHRSTVLASHVGLGILIVLLSLGLALAAFRAAGRGLRWVSTLGLLAVVAAGFNGASFLSYYKNLSSMIMAAAFAVAVFCFSWVIFRAGAKPPKASVSNA